MFVLVFCAFAAVVILWSINRWRCRSFTKLASQVPSNKWHTFLAWGKIINRKDIMKSFNEHANKYGPNSVYWMGPYSYFLSSDPEVLKDVFTAKNCIEKPMELYNGVVSVAGQGLITENDPIWSQHRKLLNKAFSNKNLMSFLPEFHSTITSFMDKLEPRVQKQEHIDMLIFLREMTLYNATQTTLKRNLQNTSFNSTSMAKYFQAILQFTADVCLHRILTIDWVRKLAEIFIYKNAREGAVIFRNLINDCVYVAQKPNPPNASYIAKENTVLDYILSGSQQNLIDANEIQGHIIHLFIAAFETTSSTLFFALILLAMHPEYQERAYEEVSKIISANNEELTIDQLDQLIYIEMIFNEAMRVLPIVPMVFRKVSNEDLLLSNGVTLPVGQIIAIDIFRLHRRKDLWGPKAEAFNPDNFLPTNMAARHPFAFIPFTKGQRFCIGWRYGTLFFKIALAKLIKTYKFSTDLKLEDLKFENNITLKLVEQPRIQLERRNE